MLPLRNNLLNTFLILTVVFFDVVEIRAQTIQFRNLTMEDGLSNNKVNTVIQDKTGFIWFGTEDGLDCYDGYNFKIFRHDPDDSNSISDNSVWALLVDHSGYIWVGTKDGILNQYDPRKKIFVRWELKINTRKGNSIACLYEDSQENIWLATRYRGVYKLNPKTKEVLSWETDISDSLSLSHHSARAITEDDSGNILIGTYYGFDKFNLEAPGKGFKKFFYEPGNPNSLSDDQIYNLSKSSTDSNIIWIGTPGGLTEYYSNTNFFRRINIPNPNKLQFGIGASTVIEKVVNGERILWTDTYSGLLRMNMSSGEWHRFLYDKNDPSSIISNQINKIFKDKSGIIWIATENGISFYSPISTRFNSIFNEKYKYYLKAVNKKKNLRTIIQNKNGEIWLGFSNGIIKLKDNEQTHSLYKYPEIDNLGSWSMAIDDNNSLWIGTFGQGLKQFDPESGKIKDWVLRFPQTGRHAVPYVKSLLKDNQNNIWVGYWGSGVGRINPASGKYDLWITQRDNPKSIINSDVWTIKEDRFGRIWLGTIGGGLNLFMNKEGGIFRNWGQKSDTVIGLSSNKVYSIYEAKNFNHLSDSETLLWIGTSNGLSKFIVKNNDYESDIYNFSVEIESFTIDDGLPDNSVNSILEDENGNLWLGTGSGISFFDVSGKSFTNFTAKDGLYGTVMNPESALKLDNGLMLFGSTKGLNIFDPQKIKLSSYKPNVVITDFQIFNKSVKIGENSPLKKSIYNSDEITLSHNQDVFSFEFAALDYNASQSIQYAYMIEGFDNDWIYSGTRRFVTYTNLDPGKYIFKVKSTNADGVWNDDVTALRIIMNPPWWRTLWAYGLYVVLIFFGLLGIRRFELNRAKLRTELKLREFEVKKKSELEELKSRFFANLSHEFRTPLMLIKGPLEQLKIGRGSNDYSESVAMIERNSNRLKELIDQLLELSQLEKAAIPLRAKQENIINILKGLVSSFESLTKQKSISLRFERDSDSIICWIDRDKFEKIINNLLSNAVKFTPVGGDVTVEVKQSLQQEKQIAEIKISDNGVGISRDKLDKIFDRFFQVDDSTQRTYGGSGIGLALVKEFVDLHKWEIFVESESEKGTEFILHIPMQDDYLSEDEKVKIESGTIFSDTKINKTENTQFNPSVSEDYEQTGMGDSGNKPVVLIVDDSDDVRKYLSSLLENNFTICEAVNGGEGIKAATKLLPDLVISDVMMPLMDGIEFCRSIKSEWQTSDIPVILLTAKASSESKIEGLETGADDYLTKPFDSRELFTRIKNLLEQRKRLREKYSKDIDNLSKTNGLSDADDEFIKKTLELIEKKLDKTNFGTEQLAKDLFVSRTQLHRKILSITGQAPGEFVRLTKLKHAAKLLIGGKLSVTQIAYEIGFSSPSQFTRAFTKQFNCLPSEYPSKINR